MNIGFISTRLAGTDGVSLETQKLATVLHSQGHNLFYCAGELEQDLPGMVLPEIHFQAPTAIELGNRAFADRTGPGESDPTLLADINRQAQVLAKPLRQFIEDYRIDYVIPQNIFAIPMQLPLAQALTSVLETTGRPGLAHNHDFYWERPRFLTNRIPDFLDTYFPPALPGLQHAVINSLAQAELKRRRGLDSILLPNVFDFAHEPPEIDEFSQDFRQAIGLSADDWLILQPTRVIPRKGVELAIECLGRLNDPRAKLVITHPAGDEGLDYLHALQTQAQAQNVDLRYVADMVGDHRRLTADGQKIYALWDTYPHADLVMYPSLIEGFGNALLETIYFQKPALVNRYPVYAADIGPLGFEFIEIDGTITETTVAQVRDWLHHPEKTIPLVSHNYRLARQHFSYETIADILEGVLPSN